MTRIKPRFRFTKSQKATIISTIAALGLAFFCLGTVRAIFFAIPILALVNYFNFKRIITTKKSSVLVVKTIRPLIYFFGIVMLIGSVGNKEFGSLSRFFIAAAIAAVYVLICSYEVRAEPTPIIEHAIALGLLFLSANAASLALALTTIPVWVILLIGWAIYFLIANSWLFYINDHPENLALIWALIGLELALISSYWIIFYSLPRTGILISQSALIITTLGYSLGGIYYHHRKKTLSRALIFEYLSVAVLIFIVLVVLTRWRSVV